MTRAFHDPECGAILRQPLADTESAARAAFLLSDEFPEPHMQPQPAECATSVGHYDELRPEGEPLTRSERILCYLIIGAGVAVVSSLVGLCVLAVFA